MQKLLEKLQMVNPDFSGAKCEKYSYSKLYDKKIYRNKGRGYALHEEISVNDKELIISLHIGEKYHNILSNTNSNTNNWVIDACCVQGYKPHPHHKNKSEFVYEFKYQISNYDDNNSLKVAEATALIQYFHRMIGKPILDSLCSIDI